MNILVAVGHYHPGTTAEYVESALKRLGHQTTVAKDLECYESLESNSYELYICVDSGKSIDLTRLKRKNLENVAYWFIDYRHNKERAERSPADRVNAIELLKRGGTVFQAQFEDFLECKELGPKVHFLPLAADPEIWVKHLDAPVNYDLGFVGNIWDESRLRALKVLQSSGIKFCLAKPGSVWKEEAAKLLSQCRAGFNINSFFGTSAAYDVNMRVFETLSCGVPLITNYVPNLDKIFGTVVPFIRTYNSLDDLVKVVHASLADTDFLNAGDLAAKWIRNNGTYDIRLQTALKHFTA